MPRSRSLSSPPSLSIPKPGLSGHTHPQNLSQVRSHEQSLMMQEKLDATSLRDDGSSKSARGQGAPTYIVTSGCTRSAEVHVCNTKTRESDNVLGESEEDSDEGYGWIKEEYNCEGEELSQEDNLTSSCKEVSILDRLGLKSTEMADDEMEDAFLQLALAFRCDKHTLQRRLQAEEHARNVAERNSSVELEQGREALQALKSLCLESKCAKILHRLELCLDVLASTVERVASTAEVLGAVHQEARMSCAVELMMAYVEKLQRQYERNSAELEEFRRIAQRSTCVRQLSDPRDEGDMRQRFFRSGQQLSEDQRSLRGTILGADTSQPEGRQQQSVNKDVSETFIQSAVIPLCPQEVCPAHTPDGKDSSLDLHSPSQDAMCRQRRSLGLKDGCPAGEWRALPELEHSLGEEFSLDSCASMLKQCPLDLWMSHCHWILFWLYLLVLFCVIMIGILFWCLGSPIFWK